MPRAIKDFREAGSLGASAARPKREKQDLALLGVLTMGAILALLVFAYIAAKFLIH